MKKLNESQMIIFEQEAGRALMLKNAKEVLIEGAYQELQRILPLYEEMADKKGISRVELYEFFWNKASDPSKNDGGILSNVYKGFLGKAKNFAARNMSYKDIVDAIEQIMQDEVTVALFNSLEDYKNMTADELKNDPKYKGIKTRADAVIRSTQYLFLLLGKMDPLLRGRDSAEALADMAETLGMDPKDLMDRYILGIRGAVSAATQAGVDAAKVGGSGGTGGGGNIPDSDPVTTPEEEGEDGSPSTEPTTSGDGDGRGRVLTVRSVQRPIINLVQRVAAAQDIDVSVKQAQEIAIMITKNLVNQMRANGVEFKGVTKDLKESFISQIEDILKEESVKEARVARKWMQKNMRTQSRTGAKAKGVRIGSQWIATADELFRKIKANGLDSPDSFQDSMEQMKNEPNNYLDFLDIAKDLNELLQDDVVKNARSGARRRRDELDNLRSSLMTTLNLYKQFKIVNVALDNEGDVKKISFTPESRKKYIEIKREVGTADSKRKGTRLNKGKKDTKEKDLTMSTPTSGQINISQTVAKAIQKGGLSRDDAQKLTPILKKKIQKIIAKELGADVKYLEEKINRYVSTVLKEIKR